MNKDKIKLKNFRLKKNMSRKSLAKELGLSESLLYMAETESTNPKNTRAVSDILKLRIQKVFNIDFDTDVDNEGNIITKSNSESENIIHIPYYTEVKAAAGTGVIIPEISKKEDFIFDKRLLNHITNTSITNLIIIDAKGESMNGGDNPIKNGDLLFVDTSNKEIVNNKVYVIQQDDSLRVKRISIDSSWTIHLKSDNPDKEKYADEPVKSDTVIVGRVIKNISKENI